MAGRSFWTAEGKDTRPNAYMSGFYKVGDTTKDGTKVTPSNVGTLNNSIALSNYQWRAPASKAVSTTTPTKQAAAAPQQTQDAPVSNGDLVSSDYLNSLYESYAAERQARLQEAYDRSMANINSAFDESRGLLGSNYDAGKKSIMASYKNSLGKVNSDADRSLKEAYINRMLQQRNLNQQMSAAGLSGGASESTLASMLNNYGNARNEIETTRNSNISDLEAKRQDNLASVLSQYNSSLANLIQQKLQAQTQAENALTNGILDALDKQFSFRTSSGYMNALQNAMDNQNAFQFAQSVANNPVNLVSTKQANMDSGTTNWQQYLEMIARQLKKGA